MAMLGVIGGSGLYELPGLQEVEERIVETPFGMPSSPIVTGALGDTRLAFIARHGSWNREPRCGYKVIFVSFANGRPIGLPEDVLTGFLGTEGEARGRPVGVAVGHDGALLVADDVGNCVWRVTPAESRVSQAADASASAARSR